MINPNFTPIHLVEESTCILLVRARKSPGERALSLTTREAIKGEKTDKLFVRLDKSDPRQVEQATKLISVEPKSSCLLFLGKPGGTKPSYLHVRGRWLALTYSKGGELALLGQSSQMLGTWNGGTDMLLRCIRYVLSSPDEADVPVRASAGWSPIRKIGAFQGTPTAIEAIDLHGDGTPFLYIAGPKGDRLFRGTKLDEEAKVEDVTERSEFDASSKASAWGDFDQDGQLDLASWDGKGLTIWAQQEDHVFLRSGPVAIAAEDVLSLHTMASDPSGRPGLLVCRPSGLVLLGNDGKGELSQQTAVAAPAAQARGKALRGILADFTNDGLPDLVVPSEKAGLFYRGKKGSGFGAPAICAVSSGIGHGVSSIGDFDSDGYLDVLLCGDDGTKVFHNLGNGRFAESLAVSGELSYKAARFASWCSIEDYDGDGRQDIMVTYHEQMLAFYFNRGFRSFGYAVRTLASLDASPTSFRDGQSAGAFADLNSDGAQDTALVRPNGEVWCLFNKMGLDELPYITAKFPAKAGGPFSVECWLRDRSLGKRHVRAGSLGTFFSVPESSECRLRWQAPGGKAKERKVKVGFEGVTLQIEASR